MRSLPFLLLAGLALLFLVPDAMSDEGPGPQIGFAGSYDAQGTTRGVAVSGEYAYVADGNGLVVVDVSDPTDPTYAGSYDTSGYAEGVVVAGGYAYVADGGNGLVVVDMSDPTDPTYAGGYDTSDYARAVAVSGDYAYVADRFGGLVVVDVSDPANPTYMGDYDTSGWAYGVAVSGDYAYIADGSNGLAVVDVSDPANPTLAGGYNTADFSYGMAVSGDGITVYAYVADGSNGLAVVDVSDPTDPTYAGDYNTFGYARAVAVSGEYAYVTDGGNGLVVVDVSDPTYAGGYDTSGYALGVVVSGGYAYVADDEGLVVLGPDSDNDDMADVNDVFPHDPEEWRDTDADGVGDNGDRFPDNSQEWADTDGDGTGDNSDAFPNDPDEQFDTDGDGVGDNSDSFPETALFKSWWGPGLIIFITITGSSFLLMSRTNKGILAEAEQILEELESKGGDVAPARSLIDEAQNFSWEFGSFYFGVWDLLGKPRAERARDRAGELSSKHSSGQEGIDVVDKMLKGFDKDGVDVKEAFDALEKAQNTLSKGEFAEARDRLENARDIGFKLKEEYGESMKGIDQLKAKITEFKEKGVYTDELEKILKKAEKEVKK